MPSIGIVIRLFGSLCAVFVLSQFYRSAIAVIAPTLRDDARLSAETLGLVTGVGTSLPELAAALASARRKQPELALGNVLGSNIFNSLGVIGFAAVLGPGPLDLIGPVILAAMVGAAAVAGLFAYSGRRIDRLEGVLLLIGFVVFTVLAFL